MHLYKDPYSPPLAPKVPIDRPPWIPSWKDYKGRVEWWSTTGYKDPDIRRAVTVGLYPSIEEKDIRWLDPKVPDGTSLVGPQGNDSIYHRNNTMKFDNVGNFFDYQDMIRKNSSQYQQIASKWDISNEHPGIAVNPLLNSIHRKDSKTLGTNVSLFPMGRNHLKLHYGPRFWDKPLNEGCFEKGLALVKYTVPISFLGYSMFLRGHGIPGVKPGEVNTGHLIKEWSRRAMLVPAFYAFTFGITSCASATFRDEDDMWNWVAASAVCGLAHAALRSNIPHAIALTFVGSFLGMYYQAIRVSHNGFGMPVNRISQGYCHFTGPLDWKHYPVDTLDVSFTGVLSDGVKGVF